MREDTKKLFRVTTRKGFGPYGCFYVVALDPEDAYSEVRRYLDKNELCYANERELDRVELLAENYKYAECETILLIQDQATQ